MQAAYFLLAAGKVIEYGDKEIVTGSLLLGMKKLREKPGDLRQLCSPKGLELLGEE